ncbi:MAG: tigr00093: pseudouridine synthase [Verrucomicrobiales bacterium]|nr:tigr00093: pseudouridine synthase [Verrucomicrobiales bacterium]
MAEEETLRLNRYLALAGLGSRRACEVLIANGEVEINGRIVTNLATQVKPSDEVHVGGKEVNASRLQTIVLHKPPGVICTRSDPKGRPTVYSLVAPQHKKLHYVGRLDIESEGLLVMTNDGDLTQRLTHPSHKVEKEYIVTLDHPCRSERVAELLEGIQLEEGLAKAEAIHVISPRRMVMVLQQGMNRQIRRMFDHLDLKVERLIRVRIGNLVLPDLKMGKWRVLDPREIAKLTETWSRRKKGTEPAK